MTASSAGYGRSHILALYRNCRRSMLRIPDPAQRQMYDVHLKTSFRAKRHLVPESRQAIFAIDDAREQLDRMNYFHSIREEKERQQQQQRQELSASTISDIGSSAPFRRQDPNVTSDNDATTKVNDEKNEIVQNWLKEAIPQLQDDDLARYTSHLVEDGFDSVELLEMDLMEEDLDFMKKAHRRALVRVKGLKPGDS